MTNIDDEIYDPWDRTEQRARRFAPQRSVPLYGAEGMVTRPERDEDLLRRHGGNGRPYIRIMGPDGTVLETETTVSRVTTFIKAVDSNDALIRWGERKLAEGFAARPMEFQADVVRFQEDKEKLNGLIVRAKEAGGAGELAAMGSAMHYLAECHDLDALPRIVPEPYQTGLVAWIAATQHFRMVRVEKFMVHDGIKTGGTPDRVVRYTPCENCGRSLFILDLKGLALDTRLPTPTGWTTMGEVRPGDQVLGRDGRPCTVTAKSETKRIGTYVVTFDDGATVICDSEHLWETTTGQPAVAETSVKDVETIRATIEHDHRVALPAALELPAVEVPIHPYLLGACYERIPTAYLRGSYEQRLALLQGLMDTGGAWNRTGQAAVFKTHDETLARQVEELALTLGQNPHLSSSAASGFWSVQFTPVDIVPFRLPRKAELAMGSTKRTTCARRRVVVAVEPGPDVETACIAVDSPDRMYLCGRRMVPTHNTGRVDEYTELQIAMQLGIYANSAYYDVRTGIRTPQEDICRCKAISVKIFLDDGSWTTLWTDIWTGWEVASTVAPLVHRARKNKGLLVPFEPEPDLHALIGDATSRDDLVALHNRHLGRWGAEHNEVARARLAELARTNGGSGRGVAAVAEDTEA